MNCKEFEGLIPGFLCHTLDYKTLKAFLQHMASCADCTEEVTIQILVTDGMSRLEEGSAFDLQGELRRRLAEAGRKVRFHKVFLTIGFILEILAMLVIAGAIFWIL
ncbi:MAG: zf-HC2 domain-containing protein [Clostridium sp.]|jgi:hypothetical protein|nr:zf-HC2 domain-containing protein [Clostridium sp.]